MNLINLIIVTIIILSIVFIKSINGQRVYHTSIVLNNTLYIVGGLKEPGYYPIADSLTLDLTKPQTASSISFGKIPDLPIAIAKAAITDFENPNELLLIGGVRATEGGALMYE